MTAKTSYFGYSNEKTSGMPHNVKFNGYQTVNLNVSNLNDEIHVKMCKKIAQLTKVIYALNTRNDDHEDIVAEIKERHELQMQHYLKTCEEKLSKYQSMLVDQKQLEKKLTQLQTEKDRLSNEKAELFIKVNKLKYKQSEVETNLKIKYSEEIVSLTNEVMDVKNAFSKLTTHYEENCTNLKQQSSTSIKDMIEKHEKTLETLKKQHDSQLQDLRHCLRDDYSEKLSVLENAISQLESEKKDLHKMYEANLRNFKTSQQLERQKIDEDNENVLSEKLKQQCDKLTRDFNVRDEENQKLIDSLRQQLAEANVLSLELEDSLEKYKTQISQQNSNEHSKAELLTQLREKLSKLESLNTELSEDAENQVSIITNLRVNNSSLVKQISSLKNDVEKLESASSEELSKRKSIQADYDRSQKKHSQEITTKSSEISNLNEMINLLTKQLSDSQKKYENLAKSSRSQMDAEKKRNSDLTESIQKYANEQSQAKRTSELQKQLNEECEKLRTELNLKQTSFSEKEAVLKKRIAELQDEKLSLQKEIQYGQQQTSSDEETMSNLRKKLTTAEDDALLLQGEKMRLEGQLGDLKIKYEEIIAEGIRQKLEFDSKLQSTKQDIINHWKNKLESEQETLRNTLSQRSLSELNSKLTALQAQREQEISSLHADFEQKMAAQSKQITDLQRMLDSRIASAKQESAKFKQERVRENSKMQEELSSLKQKYSSEIEASRHRHQEEIKKTIAKVESETKQLEARLIKEHSKQIEGLLASHQSEMKRLREELKQSVASAEDSGFKRAQRLSADEKEELMNKFKSDQERTDVAWKEKLENLNTELSSLRATGAKMESDSQKRLVGLQDEVRHRDAHIATLSSKVSDMENECSRMKVEADFKSQEIQRVHAEALEKIRRKEYELQKNLNIKVDEIQATHLREKQMLLSEFTRVKENAAVKMNELNNKLRSADEKYRNRESREDDVAKIKQLTSSLAAYEEEVKKLLAEKEYYQRELVNRETNFNKVFNSSPNVGVINPLAKSKTATRSNPHMKMSTPPRLEPLVDPPSQRISQSTPNKQPKRFL